jgi:hypothetical protein
MSPVRYKVGFYIPEDGIIHSHRRENNKYYDYQTVSNSSHSTAITRTLAAFQRIGELRFDVKACEDNSFHPTLKSYSKVTKTLATGFPVTTLRDVESSSRESSPSNRTIKATHAPMIHYRLHNID